MKVINTFPLLDGGVSYSWFCLVYFLAINSLTIAAGVQILWWDFSCSSQPASSRHSRSSMYRPSTLSACG